jgi:hypothetical protein
MSIRWLVLGALVLGAAGQLACTQTAEAAQETTTSDSEVAKNGDKPTGGQFCGGFAAIQCPEGLICVDDPHDSCDPNQGGADCGGVCVDPYEQRKPKCDYKDPNLSYVSRDPTQCLAILFRCPEGSTQFFNDCGCGCQKLARACNFDDPNRRYVSRDPAQCAAIRFFCNEGESPFFDDCGCGCEWTPMP